MKFKDLDAQEVERRVKAYVDRIQEAFRRYGNKDSGKQRMGTTLTSAYLLPPHVLISSIGDSRAYLMRNDYLIQITRDHTLAQSLIDSGSKPEDVRKFGHVLMNCLGSSANSAEAETIHVPMLAGDRLLVCTDGLSDLVDAETIATEMMGDDLQYVCDQLVERALEQGGKDNITLVVGELQTR